MSERIYYDRGGVRISSTRAVFDSRTYALAAVTSVAGRRLAPARNLPYMVIGGGALVVPLAAILLISGASVLDGSARLVSGLALIAGLAMIAAGAAWASRIKPKYAVVIRTSGGERQAFVSPQEGEIGAIVAAINQAVVGRG